MDGDGLLCADELDSTIILFGSVAVSTWDAEATEGSWGGSFTATSDADGTLLSILAELGSDIFNVGMS